ncbi:MULTISPECIES: hypothetical protein [Pseudescherichia]|uniref:hypothetical protein n=1 Tax=Pseudescherichia TaxID=2055880 RepID=UPI00301CF5EA
MSYYKYNSAEALAALADMESQERDLKKLGESFAGIFGGKPVFQKTASDWRFHGIRFEDGMYGSHLLWTKPNANNGWSQQPRVKVPANLKEESKALWFLWNEKRPDLIVSRDQFYESLGLDWGNLLFGGFEMFRLGDVIFVGTGCTPKSESGAVEILGSEYISAKLKAVDENSAAKAAKKVGAA